MSDNVKAAVQRVIDLIATEAEDVHQAADLLNASGNMIAERLKAAQKEGVEELQAMIAAKRQTKRAEAAKERLKTEPVPVIPSKGKAKGVK